ncbi:MAG: c-type cytochrome [Janthinobacterium lividum]
MLKKMAVIGGLLGLAGVGLVGVAGYFTLTAPATWSLLHPSRDVADAAPADLARGHALFYAGGCGTCHATPNQADETRLGGGVALTSGFGTFYMPNISPDPADGIGGWTVAAFTRAMREGVSRDGANEYPAFPYTSFQRMTANDLRDLFGFIQTLPPVAGKAPDHALKFPFTMRRGVGLWKLAFLDGEALPPAPGQSPAWLRGRALVEGAAHCAECHSPRNPVGAIEGGRRFAGAPDPEGHGYIPNITPDETGIGYWSVREIADYLGTGISPVGLTAGGSMAAVVANLATLPAGDRAGMAEYLKSLPAIHASGPGMPPANHTPVIQLLPAAPAAVSPTVALSVAPETAARARTLYAVATKTLFLTRPGAGPAVAGNGQLMPAARLEVVGQDGEWLQVRIAGWREKGSPSAVYALPGQRILVAALDPAAMATVGTGPETVDPATKAAWSAATLTAWVGTGGVTPDLAAVWAYSGDLYNTACGGCHALHPASSYLANQWIGNLKAMKRFTALDDGQYRLLQSYLQFHARDVGAAAAGKGL